MRTEIEVRGARQHNLKNINVKLPRDRLIVMTGVSGSGKSSLAFDTLYAEGQMRYVESLSSYARQFLGQRGKPDVDAIEGLSPAIAMEQKTTSNHPRSTVGTVTEIYDYLRLLWARIGQPHCPVCGREILRQSVDQIVRQVQTLPPGVRFEILAPVVRRQKGGHQNILESARKSGFVRVRVDGEVTDLSQPISLDQNQFHNIEIVVDRLIGTSGEDQLGRLADSIETACALSHDVVMIHRLDTDEELLYSQSFTCPTCGISIPELSPKLFSFNSPFGACPACSGLGFHMKVDPARILPDRKRSLRQGGIAAVGWSNVRENSVCHFYYSALGRIYDFDLDTPLNQLSKEALHVLLYGTGGQAIPMTYPHGGLMTNQPFEGVIPNLERRHRETQSDAARRELESYMSPLPCPTCHGDRLSPSVLAVTVGGISISDFCNRTITEALDFITSLRLFGSSASIAEPIVNEVRTRLGFLQHVGLGYLTLARAAGTLSGGESQRIRLATQIGSRLTGVLYILDEPSIGLHQRDNQKLLDSLKQMRDLGNTLIVVEHDEEAIRQADWIVDIGPGPGERGGQVVAEGTVDDIMAEPQSITGQYLSRKQSIPVPAVRRAGNGHVLSIVDASEHNLKHIDVSIPLGTFTCITGVSGSGKSSLVNEILYKKLAACLNHARTCPGAHGRIEGMEHLDKVIHIDQTPIGRTPRSTPATYTGLFDDIRALFAATAEAKSHGYGPGRFSFNLKGGRCEACCGDGLVKIEMHFLPDLFVPCEVCKGKRYNRETLKIRYKGKSIADLLDMTASDALALFAPIPKLRRKLEALCNVGLGYMRLGQASTTLSGGEAQRVKLAAELLKPATGSTIYILDEPTTGLHMADVHQLISVLHALVDAGNTIVVIEHNLDVIKNADYIIDLGPEGGDAGGEVICTGTPEQVAQCPSSFTGQYLKRELEGSI